MKKSENIKLFSKTFLVGIVFFLALFSFFEVNYLNIFRNIKGLFLEKTKSFGKKDPETQAIADSSQILEIEYDPLKIYDEENIQLKEWSQKSSPNGKKVAYYQNKFVHDIKEIGDPDYTSLIVEKNGNKETIFQGNFHLSHFEWLNNNEIKVYKGCGSNCLLSYVVNIHSKKYRESVEQIFHFE